jgi:hypothetical protein
MSVVRVSDRPSPFKVPPPPKPRGWLARLLRLGAKRDARASLEALLAQNAPEAVRVDDVSRILAEAKVTGRAARELLTDLWAAAYAAFLADDLLSDAETAYLRSLRAPLGVTDREVAEIERAIAHPKYKRAVDEVLRDGRLTPSEKKALERFAAELRLGEPAQRSIMEPAARAALSRAADQAAADERLSPDEDRTLVMLAQELGVPLEFDARRRRQLERMALFWSIENGRAPTYDVPITLQRGERCHFVSSADWYELRTKTVRVNYSGFSTSIRICKGVRYRVGTVTPQRVTRDELTHLDRGTVYFTNKRVIFDGERKNTAIRHSALIGFRSYADGVVLEKATGKSPHLILTGDAEVAAVTLGALLADA